jgi:hypothetical protein
LRLGLPYAHDSSSEAVDFEDDEKDYTYQRYLIQSLRSTARQRLSSYISKKKRKSNLRVSKACPVIQVINASWEAVLKIALVMMVLDAIVGSNAN